MLSGFAGYDVSLAWTGPAFPYIPVVDFSADGDTLGVGFYDPTDVLFGGIETLLLSVDAPAFRLNGTGSAGITLDTFGTGQVALSGPLPTPSAVPLPAGGLLLLGGLGGIAVLRRRART
ncbi:VPLPA-CTERM sorting domain-containing protein [Rhodobacterales bacterium HKCCE2091]|nr:VPLPA-CTERM sorting domain-containing protein [Rhodobacterales bacterium HKCCE2091]